MRGMKFDHVALAVAFAVAVSGCASGLAPAPQSAPALAIDRQSFVQRLAFPETVDWSTGRVSLAEADRLRASRPEAAARQRRVQAVTASWNRVPTQFGAPANSKISSAPAYDFRAKKAYWVTDNGYLLIANIDINTGAASGLVARKIPGTDTFPNTAVTVSNDGNRLYLCSAQGNFYAVDALTGANVAGSPVAMGGANANVGFTAPAFIDARASRDDGQYETIYAINNSGRLYRMHMTALTGTPPQLSNPDSYQLPLNTASASYGELFRGGPVVIDGRATIGSWYKHSTTSTLDRGYVYHFDTGVRDPLATSGGAGTLTNKVALNGPVWAPPAVEVNDALTPVFAFAPTGYVVSMVDLATGDQAQTVSLLVDKTSVTSGTLAGYTYELAGNKEVTVAPVASGGVTDVCAIADDTTLSLPQGNLAGKPWIDVSGLYAAARYDGSVATPIWGYAKYRVTTDDVTVNGTVRAILDAQIDLKVSSSSNANGNLNPDPLRIFRVANTLTTGAVWTAGTITPSTRPGFEGSGADPFTLNNLNSHADVEFTPVGHNAESFKNGSRYLWSGKGLVTAPDADYTFGLAHKELPYQNTANNNGQPFKDSAPRFAGSGDPKLLITLSNNAIATPTMAVPVTIDSSRHQIYIVNTNALYTVSYASPTYDAAADPFTSTAFAERKLSFGDASKTFFALTSLGRNAGAGPIESSRFVANRTAPLFTGTYVYVQDHHPTLARTTVTRFNVGTAGAAATYVDAVDLTATQALADRGATYMAYDYVGANLYAGSYDADSNAGHAWMLTQQ